MKLAKDFKLTQNFMINEFLHSDDKSEISVEDYINIHRLCLKLQELRNIVGGININSGYRSNEYNKKIGGSTDSYHTYGLAADIKFSFASWTIETLLPVLNYLGFTNAGFYMRKNKFVWIHLDIGKTWGNKYGWQPYNEGLSYKIYEV